jgi:predicted PurR-regulated permease PerM
MHEVQKGLTFVAVLASIILTGWLLVQLGPVLAPFIVAAFIAYLADPIVEKLSKEGKYKIPRTVSVIIVFVFLSLMFLLFLLYLIPTLHKQLSELISAIPSGIEWVQQVLIPKIENLTGTVVEQYDLKTVQDSLIKHWTKASDLLSLITTWILHSGMTIVHWGINLFLIVVVTFYLLRDWHFCLANIQKIVPQSYRSKVVSFFRKADEVMGSFLKGQLTVMLCLGVIYSVGLSIIGIKFSVLLGLGAGLLSIVPYLGSIAGVAAALLVALAQAQDVWLFVWVAAVFGVGQAAEGMLLTPLLVGDKLGLHPVAVIFAVLAGGQLFGMVGILLAIPITAILVVLLREPVLEWASRS